LTGKTYNDGVTNSANFVYDLSSFWGISVSNPKGRMIAETSGAGLFGNVYSYDVMGRRQNTWQIPPIIAGHGSYAVNYTYDLLGDLTSLYNGFEGVTYTNTYDTAARLTKLQSTFSDANHPGTLLTVNQYNPLSELQQATLGNGIARNLQFDKRGRITSLTDGSVYSFALGFAPDSNILTGNDPVNGNWTYAYDDFSRLSTSSKTGQAFNYKYDRFGNRWQQNATVGGGPQPQYMFDANNHIVGNSYDAAGNMTNDGTASYQYDPEHRLISVSPLSGAAASYTYDASGRRVQSTVGTSTVDYLYDQAGRAITQLSSAGWVWSELYAGGQHIATYSAGTTTFDHSDWLGTVRAHSSVSGASAETCTSLPFGDAQTCTSPDWSLLHFTGQVRDSESNLDHFMFRQYSSTQGRWMMPDPAGMAAVDPSNPQSWNRYAYVRNGPIALTDPTGLDNSSSGFASCSDPKIRALCTPSQVPGNPLAQLGSDAALFGTWDQLVLVEIALQSQQVPDQTKPWIVIGDLNGQIIVGGCDGCVNQEIQQTATIYPNIGLLSLLGFGVGFTSPANNGYNAFGGIPNAPAIVGARIQECYNNFHHTTAGKLAQLGSLTALTPADPEWKSNWEETLGLGTLKALLVGGAVHSEIGVISAVGHFAENAAAKVATPLLFTATSVDTGALAMCTAGAVSSLGSGW